MKTTKAEQIRLIDKAYSRLSGCCEHTHDWDRYVALIEEEEKGHRRFKPGNLNCGLTKAQAVHLFAVKELFERFVPAHPKDGGHIFTPTAKDYFSIRGSVFGACSIAESCKAEIRNKFTLDEMCYWLDSVDYCELNKDPRTVREEIAA